MGRWLVLLGAVGCAGAADSALPGARSFPEGFLWGSATAGFQVEMGCPTLPAESCEDRASDWYQWVSDPDIVADPTLHVSGEPVAHGPGMWETFEADADRMQADHHSAYRMSVEWSRLFPDRSAATASTVEELAAHADPEAVARYHEMLAALRDRGIEPLVTMNHYTLPLWVHDGVECHPDPFDCEASGWVDKDRIVPWIGLYAAFLGQEFGAEVDTWFTLNEPFATTLSGYFAPGEDRSAPPGVSFDEAATVAVMLHQIEGHAAMADAVRSHDTVDASGDGKEVRVGIVLNMVDIVPSDPESELDLQGAEHMDYLYHRVYVDALTTGAWDPDLDGVVDETRADLADRLDLLGINYYNEVVVTGLPIALAESVPTMDFFPEFSWDPGPDGLGAVVHRAADFGLPIMVTENGTPHVEEQGVEVLEGHLASLHAAMRAGAQVEGYMYWSFVDNYEWNHGFDLRFGLYELDPTTKARIPRPVRDRFAEIASTYRLD